MVVWAWSWFEHGLCVRLQTFCPSERTVRQYRSCWRLVKTPMRLLSYICLVLVDRINSFARLNRAWSLWLGGLWCPKIIFNSLTAHYLSLNSAAVKVFYSLWKVTMEPERIHTASPSQSKPSDTVYNFGLSDALLNFPSYLTDFIRSLDNIGYGLSTVGMHAITSAATSRASIKAHVHSACSFLNQQ